MGSNPAGRLLKRVEYRCFTKLEVYRLLAWVTFLALRHVGLRDVLYHRLVVVAVAVEESSQALG